MLATDYTVDEIIDQMIPILKRYIDATYDAGKEDYLLEAEETIRLKAWEDALASRKIDVSKTFKDALIRYLQGYESSEYSNAVDYVNAHASEIISLVTLELINNGYVITKK